MKKLLVLFWIDSVNLPRCFAFIFDFRLTVVLENFYTSVIFFSYPDVLQATFKITLEVPSELVALSNMPVAEEKVDGVVKTLSFEESPIMSTYLVAIVVGLFDYIEDKLPDGTI